MDRKAKKEILGRLMYGLYIVTSRSEEQIAAAGVSWFSQCSFEPPLVMMALRKDSPLCATLRRAGKGVVHPVPEGQEALVKPFFGTLQAEPGRLNDRPYRLEQDQPVLTDCPWHLVIEAREWVDRGDHAVLIAAVVGAGQTGEGGRALALYDTPFRYGG